MCQFNNLPFSLSLRASGNGELHFDETKLSSFWLFVAFKEATALFTRKQWFVKYAKLTWIVVFSLNFFFISLILYYLFTTSFYVGVTLYNPCLIMFIFQLSKIDWWYCAVRLTALKNGVQSDYNLIFGTLIFLGQQEIAKYSTIMYKYTIMYKCSTI